MKAGALMAILSLGAHRRRLGYRKAKLGEKAWYSLRGEMSGVKMIYEMLISR